MILFLKQREKNRLRKSYQEEELREKILLKKISIESENLKDYVIKNYQIKACNKCNEIEMKLIEVSPNGRSVLYRCEYCKHNMHGNILIGHDAIYPSQKYKDIIDLLSQSATSGTLFNTSVNINFTVASNNERNNAARIKIPEEVRHEVWRRDLGRCVNCGSQNKLEFDHIIPLSKGGSDSARNIQLLCEECNRKKSAKI
ncbi:MAG: HNH endonuclease [Lentisphaerota bacterium]